MNTRGRVLALIVATCTVAAGCGKPATGTPAAGTFAAEAKPTRLFAGQEQGVELTLHFNLPANPAAATAVTYRVQVTPPPGWTVEPAAWEMSQAMKTTDIGFRDTRKMTITVPADAPEGEHALQLSVTREGWPAQSPEAKVQVARKGN